MNSEEKINISEFWRTVKNYCGLKEDYNRNPIILEKATERAKILGLSSVFEYMQFFASIQQNETEFSFWLPYLTENDTYFYRNPRDWDAIVRVIIPELFSHRKHEKSLRILSLGCATGEEVYTTAFALTNWLREIQCWDTMIHGVDIRADLISIAKQGGLYSDSSIKLVDPQTRRNYLKRMEEGWFVCDELRKMATFSAANILTMDDGYKQQKFDLILCRNVLSNFEDSLAVLSLQRITRMLSPEGYLILGHSEAPLVNSAGYFPNFLHGCLTVQIGKQRFDADKAIDATLCDGFTIIDSNDTIYEQHEINRDPLCSLSPIKLHIAEARRSLASGNAGDARKRLHSILLRDIKSTEAFYLLGISYENMEELENAVSSFEQALELSPDHLLSCFHAAMIHHRIGNTDSAYNHFIALSGMLEKRHADEILDVSEGLTVGFAQLVCRDFLKGFSFN